LPPLELRSGYAPARDVSLHYAVQCLFESPLEKKSTSNQWHWRWRDF